MSRNAEGFLGRWSARKQAAREEPVEEVPVEPVVEADPEPERTDAEILEEHGLKDPDALQAGDDFSGFMSSAIPERLRNRALRKLWLTNPVLANVDELVDYGEDFTDAAMVVENLQTAYRVGKGFLRQEEALPEPEDIDSMADVETAVSDAEEPEAARDALEDGAADTAFSSDEKVAECVDDRGSLPSTEVAEASEHREEPDTVGLAVAQRPRRMVFRAP